MLTYTGINKEKFVATVREHREMDAVAQGTYGTQNGSWKGCAVACSLRSLDILEGVETKDEYFRHKDFEDRG